VPLFCLFSFSFFYGVFVRFSTRGVQKNHVKLFGGSPCQKPLAEKVKEKNFFAFVFSHRFFLSRFLAVPLHEEPKNTIKARPENLKKSQKRQGGRCVAFFFFFLRLRRPLVLGASAKFHWRGEFIKKHSLATHPHAPPPPLPSALCGQQSQSALPTTPPLAASAPASAPAAPPTTGAAPPHAPATPAAAAIATIAAPAPPAAVATITKISTATAIATAAFPAQLLRFLGLVLQAFAVPPIRLQYARSGSRRNARAVASVDSVDENSRCSV
jgi:hypothetical protein